MKHGYVRKMVLGCWALLCLAGPVRAVDAPAGADWAAADTVAGRKKVGVVLSGGGAKGVAHIGVLRELERAGIPIDYIAGTSMGSIVGGLYAIGYSVDQLDSMVRTQDWAQLLSDRVRRLDKLFTGRESSDRYLLSVPLSSRHRVEMPSGAVGGVNVYNLLLDMTVGYHDSVSFDRLPIPFACVAYDMAAGEEVVQRSGVLAQAIRASMSIPGAFTPVERDGMVLVDGGIYNNFPADVVRDMGAEVVIGVDVGAGMHGADGLQSIAGIFDQITTILGREKHETNMELLDLYIKPDIEPYNAASFSAAAIDSLLERGRAAGERQYGQLLALKEKIGIPRESGAVERSVYDGNTHRVAIGRIRFEGLHRQAPELLLERMGIDERSEVRLSDLSRAIDRLRGMGTFSQVTYSLRGAAPYELVVQVQERFINSLNLGVRFDSEEFAAILLNSTVSFGRRGYSMAELTARLSSNPYVQAGYSVGRSLMGRFNLSYRYAYLDYDLYAGRHKESNVTMSRHTAEAGYTNIMLDNYRFDVGLRFEYIDYKSLFSASGARAVESHGYPVYYVSAARDTYDNYYLPTRGLAFKLRYELITDDLTGLNDGAPLSAFSGEFGMAVPLSPSVALLPSVAGRVLLGGRGEVPFGFRNALGGYVAGRFVSQQIPFVGVLHMQPAENAMLTAGLNLRVRVARNNYLFARSRYGRFDNRFARLFSGRGTGEWGYGIGWSYGSPLGPVEINIGRSSLNRKITAYVNFGRYF